MTTMAPLFDLFDPQAVEDPYPLWRAMREQAPVYRVPGTDCFFVTSWAHVAEAMRRTEDFSSNLTGVLVTAADGTPAVFDMDPTGAAMHVLATADAPSHPLHRRLVGQVLAPQLRALAPRIPVLVDQLWSQLPPGRIDWVSGMADRLPMHVLAEVLGIPDEHVPELQRWAYDSTELLGGFASSARLRELVHSATELAVFLKDSFAQPHSPRSLMGTLRAAVREGRVGELEAVMILVQMVDAGAESTAALLASSARFLAEQPEWQDRLRAQPKLIPAFLEEMLRLDSPFRGHYRHAVSDTTLGDVRVPAGSHVMLVWGAANRDPAAYPDPDSIDITRPRGRSHLAFGGGVHLCLGSALARAEGAAAIEALLARTRRIALVPDAAPVRLPSVFVRRHLSLPLELS